MPKQIERPLLLKIPAEKAFLRLVPDFVRQGATGLGLEEEAAEELALAAEEIMAYLVRTGSPGVAAEIGCFAGSHYVQTEFSFPFEKVSLRAFNMTATLNLDDALNLEEMELLIASRMVDRFKISRRSNGKVELTLVKEFVYPEPADNVAPEIRHLSRYTLVQPDAGQIKWFMRLVSQLCPPSAFPRDFLTPGKIVDMAAAGDYQLLVAIDPSGCIGGGIAWRAESRETVELFGPYVFHERNRPQMAGDLLDDCLGRIARTSALVLLNRLPSPHLPQGYLEPLGTIGMPAPDGSWQQETAYFREMHEDMGAVAYVHPVLHDFLAREYERLYLPREIRSLEPEGETADDYSVFSAEMDRRFGKATLRPIWPGADRLENLEGHIKMMKMEAIDAIFFEMDVGLPWQAEFAPALLHLGFTPRILLPHAGSGDVLLFELTGEQS